MLPTAAQSNSSVSGIRRLMKAMAEQQPPPAGKLPIPPLPTTAYTAKRTKKKMTGEEKQTKKKELDRARDKTRINIGVAFHGWRELRDLKGFKTDSELATFLLDSYRNQVSASIPTDGDQHLTGGSGVTPEIQQASTTDDTHGSTTGVPEIVAVIDDESDTVDETEESGDQGDVDSDEDWRPARHCLQARALEKETDDRTRNEEEESPDRPPLSPKHSQLCTECGVFFSKQRSHTCEHKVKPYPCIICGKRCVSEVALNCHSRVHNENYEHRCKYCHVTFKTKVNKHTHEQSHLTEDKPYKCPDCPQTFVTNKDRGVHLEDHRGPRKLKCDICGIQFSMGLSLQRHLAVHTGLRPFKCSVCQRGFSQASHLKSHMRLHTGERPFKCQRCDRCFNHNVSLKSHVQRCHTSDSGREQKEEKINKRESDAGDAGSKKSTNSDFDDVDTKEEVQKETLKHKKRSTGRPIGRPKRGKPGSLVLAAQVEGRRSKTKTGTTLTLRQKLKRATGTRPSRRKRR